MIKIETILLGDAAEQLQTLEPENVPCCVTSPPYFGLPGIELNPEYQEMALARIGATEVEYEQMKLQAGPGT